MEGVHSHATIQGTQRHRTHGSRSGMPSNNLGNALAKDLEPSVKTQVGLLTETLETWSLLRYGTWPQLMCCALVAVQIPEVRRGQVGVSEQVGSSNDDQDSEQ